MNRFVFLTFYLIKLFNYFGCSLSFTELISLIENQKATPTLDGVFFTDQISQLNYKSAYPFFNQTLGEISDIESSSISPNTKVLYDIKYTQQGHKLWAAHPLFGIKTIHIKKENFPHTQEKVTLIISPLLIKAVVFFYSKPEFGIFIWDLEKNSLTESFCTRGSKFLNVFNINDKGEVYGLTKDNHDFYLTKITTTTFTPFPLKIKPFVNIDPIIFSRSSAIHYLRFNENKSHHYFAIDFNYEPFKLRKLGKVPDSYHTISLHPYTPCVHAKSYGFPSSFFNLYDEKTDEKTLSHGSFVFEPGQIISFSYWAHFIINQQKLSLVLISSDLSKDIKILPLDSNLNTFTESHRSLFWSSNKDIFQLTYILHDKDLLPTLIQLPEEWNLKRTSLRSTCVIASSKIKKSQVWGFHRDLGECIITLPYRFEITQYSPETECLYGSLEKKLHTVAAYYHIHTGQMITLPSAITEEKTLLSTSFIGFSPYKKLFLVQSNKAQTVISEFQEHDSLPLAEQDNMPDQFFVWNVNNNSPLYFPQDIFLSNPKMDPKDGTVLGTSLTETNSNTSSVSTGYKLEFQTNNKENPLSIQELPDVYEYSGVDLNQNKIGSKCFIQTEDKTIVKTIVRGFYQSTQGIQPLLLPQEINSEEEPNWDESIWMTNVNVISPEGNIIWGQVQNNWIFWRKNTIDQSEIWTPAKVDDSDLYFTSLQCTSNNGRWTFFRKTDSNEFYVYDLLMKKVHSFQNWLETINVPPLSFPLETILGIDLRFHQLWGYRKDEENQNVFILVQLPRDIDSYFPEKQ